MAATGATEEVPVVPSPTVVPSMGEEPLSMHTFFSTSMPFFFSAGVHAVPPTVVPTLERGKECVPATGNVANVLEVSAAVTVGAPVEVVTRKDSSFVVPSADVFVVMT